MTAHNRAPLDKYVIDTHGGFGLEVDRSGGTPGVSLREVFGRPLNSIPS